MPVDYIMNISGSILGLLPRSAVTYLGIFEFGAHLLCSGHMRMKQ